MIEFILSVVALVGLFRVACALEAIADGVRLLARVIEDAE